MSAFAERVREALHIGDFEPTSLEAEERMLSDANDFAPHLKRLHRAAHQFQKDTGDFLQYTGSFLTAAPFPRIWRQPGPMQPAEPQRPAVPQRHAALFTAELHARLAEAVPATLSAAIEADLVMPLDVWLAAHDAAKERMRRLEGRRLEYDAARRGLEAAADKAAAAEAGERRADTEGAERQLGRAQGDAEPVLAEFESERSSLNEHLAWLATAASRIKAYMADTAAAMRDAATSHTVPEGLLEPYPETARGAQEVRHG
ncbi:MAG: hypothetical protein J3K34DRAFT_139523 [Monoraphidium minutum]|nr:MAG: hypothetical protein J3K34DRAFT_139523 [Monoraphidium minutum]